MATPQLGFEIDGIPQTFRPRVLENGELNTTDNVLYIAITDYSGVEIIPTKAIKLLKKLYVFNPATNLMEQEDIVENMEVLGAELSSIIQLEKNKYIRQFKFDCVKADDQQDTYHQPIAGLTINTSHLTLKTHNFDKKMDRPKSGDLLFYEDVFWMVEEINVVTLFTPKEKLVLFIALKQINK